MLSALFADEQLRACYDMSFSYRYSRVYEAGFLANIPVFPAHAFPLRIPDFNGQVKSIRWRPLRILVLVLGYALLIRQWYVLWNTIVLYRLLRKRDIDVLHINNGGYPGAGSCTSAVFAARLAGIRSIVYVVNNIAIPYSSILRWPEYLFDRMVACWVTRFVTGSLFAAQQLKRVLRLPADKITNIPNGLTPPQHCAEPNATRTAVRGNGRFLVVVAAVLEERKGHIYLLRALDLLRSRGVPLPLIVFVGSGSQTGALRAFVARAGLHDDVCFVGHQDRREYLNFLAAADTVVLPSIGQEDFPNVVIEAMSLGKPVVGTRVAGIPEQVEDGHTGFLVLPKDIVGLADSLQRLNADPDLRLSLGRAGYERFRREFLSSIVVHRYRFLYDEMLCGPIHRKQGLGPTECEVPPPIHVAPSDQ